MIFQYVARHAEFAKAALSILFDASVPQLYYIGFLRKEQFGRIQNALSAIVYEHWDSLPEAGPRTRPRDETAGPGSVGLKVLALTSDGLVSWPNTLLSRFPEGSAERLAVEKKREDFLKQYPQAATQTKVGTESSRTSTGTSRSSGSPDYSIDGGAVPLDPTRCIELAGVPASDFTSERLLN